MLSLAALAAIATRALDSSSQASIVAAARRSRVRERQSSQRLREAASVPSGQLAGIVPDDVFRDTAIREGLASNLQEMERRRAEEQAIWAASEHDAAFAAARAALSRQSWPLSARQCGPLAVEAVRAATAECAREYLALHGELLRALEYCAPLQRGDVLHAAAATRFGADRLLLRVGELLGPPPSPIASTAASHLPTVWALFSREALRRLRRDARGEIRARHSAVATIEAVSLLRGGGVRASACASGPVSAGAAAPCPLPLGDLLGSLAVSPVPLLLLLAITSGFGAGVARGLDEGDE
ncbi:hypothetical protein EMIHUDRAFT_457116 [Emiliania huxleyi CCMP1516]|uniref:Uncharacterized protein n=2 Tax=Emiliania huxleyi TaxID=2903 RepID=A0A0D3JVM4_EMIH1|nr:hypothetical protein EMIHUDRAFT_457116 [Emiliania huxleyi CCMP1516]EOD27559.1 hypothetical protein EMIHUDRAFT_457116 [Emiliania huxleyi CCMP1516]|eukprot:XP_005779988.1 hypothetical protein EMIHUDRAFT_457116 [Emiliania huxleyi CCMP1516]